MLPVRSRARSTLAWRIFLATAAVVIAVLAVTMLLVTAASQRAANAAARRALEQTRLHVGAMLAARERALAAGTLVFVQNPHFRALVLGKRPADLFDQANEAVQRIGATWTQITDDQGVRLAKSDEPTAPAVTLAGTALVGGALEGDVVTGAGVAGDTAIFQGVAVPISAGAAQVAGVLMAAWAIDTALANAIERETASDVVFYLADSAGAPRVVAATLAVDAPLLAFLRRHHDRLRADASRGGRGDGESVARAEVTLGGREYVGQGQPLRSAGGEALGGVVTLRSGDVELASFIALRNQLLLAGALGLALAFGLSYVVARRISRPILALADATRRAAAAPSGAAAALDGPAATRADGEIGDLAEAVRSMLIGVREREVIAEYLRVPERAASRMTTPRERLAAAVTGPFDAGAVVAGRYEIVSVLGVGGAGIVYKAADRELGETVALKALRPEVLIGGTDALERLRSEIRLARRISHRNVVRTHDIGEAAGVHFITMEYVAGVPLDDLLERRTSLPLPVTLSIGTQLCRALAVAHEQGVIHRDIKPQNLVLRSDGVLKVMDFGIARLAERTSALTLSGQVVGTPAYMAPEQLIGEEVDTRADLYAAGVVLYECLTGRLPFDADSPAVLMARILSTDPPRPQTTQATIPDAVVDVVMRALSREPDQRPRSAHELEEGLVRATVQIERSYQLSASSHP